MGADQSKTPKSLAQSIDYLAANYILTSNFKDLQDLSDASSCKELVVLTSDVLDKYMTERDVSFLQQRLEGSVEKNYMTKKSLAYFNEQKLDDMDVKSDLQKKRMCFGIAKFYIRIFHVFNAIAHTVNPEYTWVDENGQSHTVGYEQKGDIPVNAKYSLTKMNLCSEKMNALVDKTNLDIIMQDDNSKDIEIKPKFCGINLNESNGTANVEDEPGMPELEKLYYDQYNYATGKFQSMSPDMKEVYEEDVKTLYKAFAHDKKSMPTDITKFSDIQLRDFENIVQCQPNGVFTKAYTGSLKEKQFQEYAENIRLMKQNTKENQEALMKILDSIFAFTPDPQTKGKKMISIHPDLTEKSLDAVVEKTREAILKLYTTCEKDFYKGLQLFEAIVWKQMLDTSVKQIDNLKQDISNEMAAQPDDVRNRGQPQQQYPGYMGLPNPYAANQVGPTTPNQGEPGNYFNNQQTYNIKQEVPGKKEEESESDSDSDSESEEDKNDKKEKKKKDKPYEQLAEPNYQPGYLKSANPIVPVARNQNNRNNPIDVDNYRLRPNLVHDVVSKEVGIEELGVKDKTDVPATATLSTGKKEPAVDATAPPKKSESTDLKGIISKGTDDKNNLKSVNFREVPATSEFKSNAPYVTELESDVYREDQGGELFCGKHAINQLLGAAELSREDMGTYCTECSNSTAPVCSDTGENCDISVLIYILATKKEKVGDFKVIVMPENIEETNVCIHNLHNVYFDEKTEQCIRIHLYENVVGCIARINDNHFVTYKKTADGNYSLIDSVIPEVRIFKPEDLPKELMNQKVSAIIIVKEAKGNVVTCKAKENIDKVLRQKRNEIDRQRRDNDSISKSKVDDEGKDDDDDEEEEGDEDEEEEEETASNSQGETNKNTQIRATNTGTLQGNVEVKHEDKESAGIWGALSTLGRNKQTAQHNEQSEKSVNPQITNSSSTPGTDNPDSALGSAFSTRGKSNKNTPSAKKTTAAEQKYKKEQKVVYTKDGISYYATIRVVHPEDAPNYYYTIQYKDGSDMREKQTDEANLREINSAEKDAIAKEKAGEIIENLKKAKETQNPPNVEDNNAQEIAKSKNTGTGIINTGIIKGIGNFFTGLVGSNPEDNTHTQKETEEQQAQKPADSAEPPGLVTRSQTNKRAQNPADSDSAKRSGNETPVVSDSASHEEDTLLASQYIQQQAQKPAETRMMTRSRANETETSQNNQPKTKASAPPNNDADVIVEDVDPLEEIIENLRNEGCDEFVIDSNYSLSHIDKCVNMLKSSITELEELHGNSNSSSTYKAKITNYLRKTIRPVKRTYLVQQTTRRNKNNIKGGARSRKKKHTKKHRKNSRRKTKSMKRVKKLKK